MKLRTKQAIGFAIVASLIVPGALAALYTFGEMHGEFEALRDDVVPGAIAMAEMEQTLTRAHHNLVEYMVHGIEEDKALAQLALADLEKAGLEHLEHERHIGAEERAAAEEMMAKVKKFASAVIGIIDLKNRGLSNAELSQKDGETVHPAEATLIQQIREHKALHMEEVAQAERAVHQAHIVGTAVVLLGTVCAVLVAAGVALITSRMIVKPLQDLEKGTELIAQGDLDHRIGASRKDEIGQVARSFDRMAEHLSKTLVSKSALEEANAALTSEMTERKRAQEALQESEEHLRITLASIGDAVIAVDTDRHVVNLNGTAEQLTGWSFQQARGRPLEEVFNIINEETRKAAPDPVARVIATGQIQGLANHTILIARDGTERAIADSAAPIQNASGKILGVVLVFRDITERRQAEKESQRRLQELERFNRLTVGREQRMIELKREVNEMAHKGGLAPPYDLAFAESGKGGIGDEL